MPDFVVYPAIDLHQGKVVRLVQGDLGRQTTYGDDPREFARKWFGEGATWIHLVNLDGAFEQADSANLLALKEIIALRDQDFPNRKLQLGGGIRTPAMVGRLLAAGVDRVVLGTMAATHPELAEEAAHRYGGERLAVALDVKDERVCIRGWVEALPLSPLEFAGRLAGSGIRTLIYTDVSRDGTSTGTNLETARRLSEQTGAEIILSGGVAGLEDIRAARRAGLAGAIVGRALYEGVFTLREALAAQPAGSSEKESV